MKEFKIYKQLSNEKFLKIENENPKLAMRRLLDEHREFALNKYAKLKFEELITFRAIGIRQVVVNSNNSEKNSKIASLHHSRRKTNQLMLLFH